LGKATVSANFAGCVAGKTVDIILTKNRFTVKKTVTGNVAGYAAGGKFDITVNCPSSTPPTTILHLAHGESADVVADAGDTCTLSESVPSGVVSSSYTNLAAHPSRFAAINGRTVEVTNTLIVGPTAKRTLTVNKTVGGFVANHDPNAEFEIFATCTGMTQAESVSLMRNETGIVEVPANVVCTITEPTPPPALGGYSYLPNIMPSVIPSLAPGVPTTVKVDNIVTNDTNQRKVNLTNSVSGWITGSGYTSPGQFMVALTCNGTAITSAAGDPMVEGYTYTYHVPNYASCSASTNAPYPALGTDYAWYSHTSTPPSPFTVTSDMGANVDHNIQKSPFKTLTVTKRVTGALAGYAAGGKFNIMVTCPSLAGGATLLQLANNESGSVIAQAGETCTITETALGSGVVFSGYTNTATISPSSFPVVANQTITITNQITSGTFTTRTLTVNKAVTGDPTNVANGHDPATAFPITVMCNNTTIPYPTLTLLQGQSGTTQVRDGANCTVSEAVPAARPGYKYADSIAPSALMDVKSDRNVHVNNTVVTDSTTLWPLTLTNAVSGVTSQYNGGDFTVTLNCGSGGTFSSTMPVGDQATYKVPHNAYCTLATAAWPTLGSLYAWADTNNLVSPVMGPQNVTVTHEIRNIQIGPVPAHSQLSITPAGPIYTSNSYTVTVTAKDTTYVNLPNATIVVTVAGGTLTGAGTGTFNPATGACTTGASGTCTMTWTSTTASPATGFAIRATVGGTDIGNCAVNPTICSPQTRVFYTDPVAWQSELTADKTTVMVGGTDKATLTVTLKDASGAVTKSVGTTTVNFGASGPGTLSAPSCTVAQGESSCFVTVSSMTYGTSSITAQMGGIPVKNSPLTITFEPTPPVCPNLSLMASPTTLDADGSSQATITATVRDTAGVLVSTPTKVFFSVPAGQGSLTAISCETSGGTCSVSYTSPFVWPATGKATVSAQIADTTCTPARKTVDINLRQTGFSLIVHKTVTGSMAGYATGGKFDITVTCPSSTPSVTVLHLAHGESGAVVANAGDTCTMSESVPGGTVLSGYTNLAAYPSRFTVINGRPVEVTNTIIPTTTPKRTLTVSKTVNGATAYHDPNAEFEITAMCASTMQSVSLRRNETGTIEVPTNVVCTIDEPMPPPALGGYSYQPNIKPSVIPSGTSNETVVVDNIVSTITWSTLTLTNVVTGQVVPSGYATGSSFNVTLTCGANVYTDTMKEGYGYSYSVPNGYTCWTSTAAPYPYLNSSYSWVSHSDNIRSPIMSDQNATITHDIQFDDSRNIYCPQSTLTASPNTLYADGSSTSKVTMTVRDGAGALVTTPTTVYFSVPAGQGSLTPMSCNTSGGSCSVDYTSPNSVPALGKATVIGNFAQCVTGKTVDINLIPRPVNYFTVQKTVTGIMAGYAAGGKFDITVSCPSSTPSVTQLRLAHGESANVYANAGDTCTMSESVPSGVIGAGYTNYAAYPSRFTAINGRLVEVTNTIVYGSTPPPTRNLTITKTVNGATANHDPNAVFEIEATCAGTTQSVSLKRNETGTIAVPTNVACTIDEPMPPPALGGYSYQPNIKPSSIPAGTIAETIVVDNIVSTITWSKLTLTNVVTGSTGSSGYATGSSFNITLNCGANVYTDTMKEGYSYSYSVPNGYTCWTSTTAPYPYLNSGYTWSSHSDNIRSPIMSDQNATITHDIQFDGSENIYCPQSTLTASPNTLYADGSSTSRVTMTVRDAAGALVTTPTTVYFSVPAGQGSLSMSWCYTSGGSCSVNYTSPSGVPAAGRATVLSNFAQCVAGKTVDIALLPSPPPPVEHFTVQKTVAGNMAGYTGGRFDVTVTCAGTPTTLHLAHGERGDVYAQPGDSCTLSESVPSGTLQPGYTNYAAYPSRFTAINGRTVEVTNTIVSGASSKRTMTVNALVGGTTANHNPNAVFEIEATCASTTQSVILMKDETGTIEAPANVICMIDEPTQPFALGGYSYQPNIKPSIIPAGSIAESIVIDNIVSTITWSTLTLTNVVTGPTGAAGYVTGSSFNVTLSCGPNVYTDTMKEGYSYSYSVPNGYTCWTSTAAPYPYLNSGYTWSSHSDNIRSPITSDQSAIITHGI